jgi:hypothetical protein
VLRPGGWFVALIGHPCFLAPHAATTQLDGQPARGRAQLLPRGPVTVLQTPRAYEAEPATTTAPSPPTSTLSSKPGSPSRRSPSPTPPRCWPTSSRSTPACRSSSSSSRSEHAGDVASADRATGRHSALTGVSGAAA